MLSASTAGTQCQACVRACRFLWVVQYLVGAGFYVIPAYMPADNSADQIVAANPDVFARNWANLWTAITEVPTFNSTLRGVCPTALFYSPASTPLQSLQAAFWHVAANL